MASAALPGSGSCRLLVQDLSLLCSPPIHEVRMPRPPELGGAISLCTIIPGRLAGTFSDDGWRQTRTLPSSVYGWRPVTTHPPKANLEFLPPISPFSIEKLVPALLHAVVLPHEAEWPSSCSRGGRPSGPSQVPKRGTARGIKLELSLLPYLAVAQLGPAYSLLSLL